MFCILSLGGIFVLVWVIIVRFLKIDLEYLLEENKKKRRHMISEGDRSLKTYKNQTIDDNHEQLIIRSVHASPRVSNSLRSQHKNENDTRLDRTSVCPEIIHILLFIYQLQSIVNSQKQKREKNDHALLFSKEKESLKNDEKISCHCEEDVLQTVEVDDYSSESTKVMCLDNRNTIPSFTYRTSNSYSPEFPSLPSSLLTYTEDDSLNYLLSSIDTVYNDIRFECLPSEDVKKNISHDHEKRCLNKIRLSSNIKIQSSGEEYQISLPTEKLVMQNKAGTGDHPNYPKAEASHSSRFSPLAVQLRIHSLANGQTGNRNVNETQQEETKSTCCDSYIQSSTTSQSQMMGEIIESAVVSCTKDLECIEGLRQESMKSSTHDSDDSDVHSHKKRPESKNETERIQTDNSSIRRHQHEGKTHQPLSVISQDTAASTPTRETQLEALMRDPMGINFDRPKYPSYAIRAVRLSSYTDWPSAMTQTPRDMALAGFFYAGYGDYTRCFFCGGGLRNWEAGDDPWVEHARWFSKCAFVRENRGQKFIDLVLRRAAEMEEQRQQDVTGNLLSNDAAQTLSKEEKIMKSAAVISIKDMGYSEEIIKTAINTIKSRLPKGKHKVSAQEILEVIFELLDSQRTSENSSSQSHPRRTADQTEFSRPAVHLGGEGGVEENISNPTLDELTSLRQEKSNLKNQTICKICMEKNVSIAFLPCGHLACCADCAPAMRKRPICDSGLWEYGVDDGNASTSNDLESLQRENVNLKEITLCKVCKDETVSVVFLPCGHLTCCADCAPAMWKCPICWKFVKSTTNAYLIRSG